MRKRKPMLSQPRTARKTASNSWRRSESGKARIRITMGLTLRRTARRIKRLKCADMLIPSGYLPTCHQTPGFLALSYPTGKVLIVRDGREVEEFRDPVAIHKHEILW